MVVSSYLSLKLAKHIEKNEKDKKKKGKWKVNIQELTIWLMSNKLLSVKSPLSSDSKADISSVSPSTEHIQLIYGLLGCTYRYKCLR